MTCPDPIDKKTIYWVYLFRDTKDESLQIGYSLNLPGWIRSNKEVIFLLYYRKFDFVADALGHKTLLERLSVASLNRIILQMNPERKNILTELK